IDTAMKKPLNPCNGPFSRPAQWLAPPLIALLTIAAFLPTLRNGFVNWDDTVLLSGNPHYRGLGWTQLRWMFTTFHMGHYQPLSWLTYMYFILSLETGSILCPLMTFLCILDIVSFIITFILFIHYFELN